MNSFLVCLQCKEKQTSKKKPKQLSLEIITFPAFRSSFLFPRRCLLNTAARSASVSFKNCSHSFMLKNWKQTARNEEKTFLNGCKFRWIKQLLTLKDHWEDCEDVYLFLWLLCKMHSQKQSFLKSELLNNKWSYVTAANIFTSYQNFT